MAMGTLRQIRRRIRTIQNTSKITRAMELVAASKMRRAQLAALAGRPYAEKMRFVLADVAETLPLADPETLHPLLRRAEEVKSIEIIMMTPDRGLCGGRAVHHGQLLCGRKGTDDDQRHDRERGDRDGHRGRIAHRCGQHSDYGQRQRPYLS